MRPHIGGACRHDWLACVDLVKRVINASTPCALPPCTLGVTQPRHAPPPPRHTCPAYIAVFRRVRFVMSCAIVLKGQWRSWQKSDVVGCTQVDARILRTQRLLCQLPLFPLALGGRADPAMDGWETLLLHPLGPGPGCCRCAPFLLIGPWSCYIHCCLHYRSACLVCVSSSTIAILHYTLLAGVRRLQNDSAA